MYKNNRQWKLYTDLKIKVKKKFFGKNIFGEKKNLHYEFAHRDLA